MPYFESTDGTELYYETIGEGDTDVLLIHGAFMGGEIWKHQLSPLSEDFRLIVLDLRGHGRSEKPRTGYSPEDYAGDIGALIDSMGLHSVILVGWSLGAIISVITASNYPDQIAKVALISSGMFHIVSDVEERDREYIPFDELIDNLRRERPAAINWFVEMIFGRNVDQATKDWVWQIAMGSALHANVNTMKAAATLQKQTLRGKLRDLEVPVGVFHGDLDLSAQTKEARFLAEEIVDEGELYHFEQSGHLPFIEQSQEFNRRIMSFLSPSE